MPKAVVCPLVPTVNNLIVKRAKPKDKTEGGILLPDTAQEKSHRAEVIAVGPGRLTPDGDRFMPLCPTERSEPGTGAENGVVVGTIVILDQWAGTAVEVDGEQYLIITDADVRAIEE